METLSSSPRIAFISGHTDLPEDQFLARYITQIQSALEENHHFILGDAAGVDHLALKYLLSTEIVKQYPDVATRITVYASRSHNVPKLKALGVNVVPPGGHGADKASSEPLSTVVVQNKGRDRARYKHVQRDAALTAASDYDILWFRDEVESREMYGSKWRPRLSATEMNSQRRGALVEEASQRQGKLKSDETARSKLTTQKP